MLYDEPENQLEACSPKLGKTNELLQREIKKRKLLEEKIKLSNNRFHAIMDGLDAVVYVADMKTHQLLFINRKALELGIDLVGGKCWQVLQSNQTGPCSFCDNDKLSDFNGKPSGVSEREFQNTVTGAWYCIKDRIIFWEDGRPVRLEIATDITNTKMAHQAYVESEKKFRTLANSSPVGIFQTDLDGQCLYVNERWCEIAGLSSNTATGLGWVQALHSDDQGRIIRVWNDFVELGREFNLDYRFRNPEGNVTWVRGCAVPLLNDFGEKTGYLGTISNITKRKQNELQINKTSQNQSIINAVLQVSLEPIPLEKQLERILDITLSISWFKMHSRGFILLREDDGSKKLFVKSQAGFYRKNHFICPQGYPDKCFCGKAMETNNIQFTDYQNSCIEIQKDKPCSQYVIPLLFKGKVLGVMNLHLRAKHKRNRDEEEFLWSIARTLAGIIQYKRAEIKLKNSREELRNLTAYLQSAREEERIYIAREIHDELGQQLTILQMELAALAVDLPQDQTLLIQKTEKLSQLIDASTKTVQRISSDLRPSILDNLGITVAMKRHAAEFQTRSGIECEIVFYPGNVVLNQKLSTEIFRIFQESLTNVARHASATAVDVKLIKGRQELTMTIEDNGKGITKEQISSSKSFGIIGIRERVRSEGGKIKVDGACGTTITINIPISPK